MKRILLFSLSVMISGILLAGGIVTNQNHSAMYTRMLARDATLGIDAVFYNPAGLTLLPNNGFYLSVNNQSLFQTRTVKTNYYNLSYNTDRSVSPYYEYTGEIQAPLFPGIYAAYVMDNWAFSVGFNPIGGGGGGTYETGLPSFEYSISDLVPALAEMGATAYSMDAYFEGLAAYFGYQANVSYKFNDKLSVALGGRYVQAKEAYNGYIRDVSVIMGGVSTPASAIFSGLATQASDGATLATGAATDINNAISGGFIGGSDPLADPTAIGTLTAFGLYTPGMTNDQAVAAFTGLATELTGQAAVATGTANVLQDQEADYEKTATGFTPIISVNFKPNDQWNFAFKYEHRTKLEFTNKTSKDFTVGFEPDGTPITMFPDGEKTRNDIPSMFMLGATFKPTDKLLLSTGIHYYFDKGADYGVKDESGEKIDNADAFEGNSYEFALGAEYQITDKLKGSAGYLRTKSNPKNVYQSDLSQTLPSNSLAGGFAYQVIPMLEVNLAAMYTHYNEGINDITHYFGGDPTMPKTIREKYKKPVLTFAVGLNFNFSAGK
jgi:long-chain fatty acid transport protein